MTSNLQAGTRCRTNRGVTSYAGRVEPQAEGKIRYVSENLGRFLVLVDWDKGGSTVLFPEEIELLGTA